MSLSDPDLLIYVSAWPWSISLPDPNLCLCLILIYSYLWLTLHCNAVASNPSLKTTFMEMGPRTKFIWSYETPICFLKSCDHNTVLYFVTTICLLLVHWKISSSYTYTTLATIEASWSFIKHSRKFWRMAVSDWSAVINLFGDRWGKLEFHKT
jgi:hypothetical protein